MGKPLVYIASPYSNGDPAMNVKFQMHMFDILMNRGLCVPVAPLWAHFQHIHTPRHYEDWVNYSLAIASRCDACLALDVVLYYGDPIKAYQVHDSRGRDKEVQQFVDQKKPVFFHEDFLHDWILAKNELSA